MEFETLDIFKEVVKNNNIYHERDIKWLKSDKQRSRAICKDEECKSMMQKLRSDYFYMCL